MIRSLWQNRRGILKVATSNVEREWATQDWLAWHTWRRKSIGMERTSCKRNLCIQRHLAKSAGPSSFSKCIENTDDHPNGRTPFKPPVSTRTIATNGRLCWYANPLPLIAGNPLAYNTPKSVCGGIGSHGFSTLGSSHQASSSASKTTTEAEEEKPLSTGQTMRKLFRQYGYTFVGTYGCIYLFTLTSIFVTLDFGLVDLDTLSGLFKVSKDLACETADIIGPTGTGASMDEAASAYAVEVESGIKTERRSLVDVVTGYMQKWEWTSRYVERIEKNPHLANLAVAWFMVKFTEPVRLGAAVIVTPRVSKIVAKVLGKRASKKAAKAKG